MESFYIDPHVHEENPILNRSGYDPYNTSQLFPFRDGPNRYESKDFIPAVVQTSTDPLFHSLTEQVGRSSGGSGYELRISGTDRIHSGISETFRSRGKYFTIHEEVFNFSEQLIPNYLGKLRSNVTGSRFRFVSHHSPEEPEMLVSFCPRIFRQKSTVGPCRHITVHFNISTSWNTPSELESVLPEHIGGNHYALGFPEGSSVISSVKNFQLRDSNSKNLVFSFHKETKDTFRIFWDPETFTRPEWVLSLGIASVERKICTQ